MAVWQAGEELETCPIIRQTPAHWCQSAQAWRRSRCVTETCADRAMYVESDPNRRLARVTNATPTFGSRPAVHAAAAAAPRRRDWTFPTDDRTNMRSARLRLCGAAVRRERPSGRVGSDPAPRRESRPGDEREALVSETHQPVRLGNDPPRDPGRLAMQRRQVARRVKTLLHGRRTQKARETLALIEDAGWLAAEDGSPGGG